MNAIAGQTATAIINKNEFSKMNIKVHTYKNQVKIGKILSLFDNKISLENNKLKKLNKYKKSLIQNMFI